MQYVQDMWSVKNVQWTKSVTDVYINMYVGCNPNWKRSEGISEMKGEENLSS